MDNFIAESRPYMLQSYRIVVRHGMPTFIKSIANQASTIMTMVIAATTELVVSSPRLSVFGLMRKPKWQAISAIIKPNIALLPKPIKTLAKGTVSGILLKNCL